MWYKWEHKKISKLKFCWKMNLKWSLMHMQLFNNTLWGTFTLTFRSLISKEKERVHSDGILLLGSSIIDSGNKFINILIHMMSSSVVKYSSPEDISAIYLNIFIYLYIFTLRPEDLISFKIGFLRFFFSPWKTKYSEK